MRDATDIFADLYLVTRDDARTWAKLHRAICEWVGCTRAVLDPDGAIWVDGPTPGHLGAADRRALVAALGSRFKGGDCYVCLSR